jgi:hypothetical protein
MSCSGGHVILHEARSAVSAVKPAAGEKFGEKTVIFSISYYNSRKLFFH